MALRRCSAQADNGQRSPRAAACQNGGSVEIKHKKAVKPTVSRLFGGPEGIRTLDLSDANRTRSQLRYRPIISALLLGTVHSIA